MELSRAVTLTCPLQTSEALRRNNAGLLRFAQRDYTGAIADFQAASTDPAAMVAAANNAAVCRVYLSQARCQTDEYPTATTTGVKIHGAKQDRHS